VWSPVSFDTPRGGIRTRLYLPDGATAGVIMVGGVGGGFDTPGRDLYPRITAAMWDAGVAALRLRFRNPRVLQEAVFDVREAVGRLAARGVDRVGLVGHSFGGAVVIRAGVSEPDVRAVVTLSTQSAGTEDVDLLAPRPLLLVHGTADPVLPARASVDVAGRAGEPKELRLLDGVGHDLLEARDEVYELVAAWLVRHLG
jgi:alpha-beta hydrolase superfamily lysophospholipase